MSNIFKNKKILTDDISLKRIILINIFDIIINYSRDLSGNKFGDDFRIILSEGTHLQMLKVNKNQLTQVPDMFFVKNITHLAL